MENVDPLTERACSGDVGPDARECAAFLDPSLFPLFDRSPELA